ncbi:MAG: transglutaminase family protein [Pseudomonadales bacterium]|nr:transglutaminase family protein [Pseudomonadales bacterium]
MQKYLAVSEFIDWNNKAVAAKAVELAKDCDGEEAITQACFEFVRDEIRHSWDYQENPVTCKASDVLKFGTGYCYAKSHLLAALLRANGIAAGLCYQRLTIEDDKPPFCLHGLNAVYLPEHGWYRLDARGNKKGVNARFTPPLEQLAFPINIDGELDLPEIWAEPLSLITQSLLAADDYLAVANNLPDIDLIFY